MSKLAPGEMIRIENFSKSFYIHHLDRCIDACKNITISVAKGEFIGITGRSGSGKSTILKAIYRTYLPGDGAIYYHSNAFGEIDLYRASERDVLYLRKYEIGYVSQFLKALPRSTAQEIVEASVLEMGYQKNRASEEAQQLLAYFGLDKELWESYPVNFSGGERLRLNVAAAMIKKPRLLLLDEPTASLDRASKARVRQLIETLKNDGTTMIGIFHDLEFMRGLCDREFKMA